MTKTILLATIISVTLLTITKRSNAQKGFYAGVQGAPLLSIKFNGSDVDNAGMDYKAKTSYAYGISAGYNFTKHLGIGTEVMYYQEKQRYLDHSVDYTEKLKYIKVPVLFTYNTNPASRIMFIAKAGPQVGILMSSTISKASNPAMNGNNRDLYKKLSLGAMLGTGARIRLTDHIYADAGLRFDGSITNLESKNYTGYQSGRGKTHAINAGAEVGIKYFLN